MATVRFSQLPEVASVQPTDVLVVEDGGGVVRRATVSQLPGTGGGSAWYDGSGAPAASLGTDGDYYLDTAVLCSKRTSRSIPAKRLILLRCSPHAGTGGEHDGRAACRLGAGRQAG